MAVAGSESYANFTQQLLSEDECAPLWDAYCAQAGLPADAASAVAVLRERLKSTATTVVSGTLIRYQISRLFGHHRGRWGGWFRVCRWA